MSQIPKPSGLPRPNFMSTVNTKPNILPSKNIANDKPSASGSGFSSGINAASKASMFRRTKTVTDTKPKPLKPVNRILPANTIQPRAQKRPAAPALNRVPAKVAKKTPIKVATGKNIRKSVSRNSVKLPPIKKPAPYDYKGRFELLQAKHTRTVAAFNEFKLAHASNTERVNSLEEELKTLKTLLVHKDESLASQTKENTHLTTELSNYKLNLEKTNNELKLAITKIEELVKNNNKLQIILEELKPQVDDLTTLNVNNKQQIESLETDLKLKNEIIENNLKKFQELDIERRKLNNDIQDLKGNIRVFCRIRPALSAESARPCFQVHYIDEKSVEICKNQAKGPSPSQFSFDRVFSQYSTQENIFEDLSQLVQSVLDGYNVCVFAYGQTGSGKTYTMEGGSALEEQGMIPRAVNLIFKSMKEAQALNWTYTIQASFLEIYNEKVRDLLQKKHDVQIKSLEQITTPINSAEDLHLAILKAQRNRTTSATESNERSSRSHAITSLIIEGYNSTRNEKTKAFLNLVDLAGSEKIQAIGTDRVHETKNINKSLSSLTHVIMCLKDNREHIPYRNSKLTYLLQSSLGGNSKTLMIVNIAPFEDCYEESTYSLRFATQVNQCRIANIRKNKTDTQTPHTLHNVTSDSKINY